MGKWYLVGTFGGDMYLWDLDGLIRYWQQNKFTTSDSFKYLFGHITLLAISTVLFGSDSAERSPRTLVFLITLFVAAIVLYITYLILKWYYEANGGDEGKHFLEKLISVSFVVDVKVTAISALPLILIELLNERAGVGALLLFLMIVLGALIYGIIAVHKALLEIYTGSEPMPKIPESR